MLLKYLYFRSFDPVFLPFSKYNGVSVNCTCHVHPPKLVLTEVI